MKELKIVNAVSHPGLITGREQWCPVKELPETTLLIPEQHTGQPWQILFPGAEIRTFPGLLEEFLANSQNQRLLGRHSIEHLLTGIINRKDNRFLNITAYRQGYTRALTDFLYNYRTRVSRELEDMHSRTAEERQAVNWRDITAIHRQYEDLLVQLDKYDFRRAARLFSGEGLPACGRPRLVLLGFNSLSELEVLLFKKLAAGAEKVCLALCRNPAAAPTIFKTAVSLEQLSAELQTRCPSFSEITLKPQQRNAGAGLSNLIFQEGNQPRAAGGNAPVMFRAKNRFTEVRLIAREIIRLRETKTAFDSIAVACPAYDTYAPLFRNTFRSYGIPFSLHNGIPVRNFPLAGLFLDILNQAVTPSPYLLRAKIFSSPYISFTCPVDGQLLEEFLTTINSPVLDLTAADFRKHLKKRGNLILDYFSLQTIRNRAYRTINPGSQPLSALQVSLLYLHSVLKDNASAFYKQAAQLVCGYYTLRQAEQALQVFSARMNPAAFTAAMRKVLGAFHIAEQITAAAAESTLAADEKESFSLLLKVLDAVAAQFLHLSAKAEQKFPLVDYVRYFQRLCTDRDYSIGCHTSGGVRLVAPDYLFSYAPDYLFLCGMVDGEFPLQDDFNFLNPRQAGKSILEDFTSVEYDRCRFYQLLAAAVKQLYLSCPRSDAGRNLPVSPFYTEAAKHEHSVHREHGEVHYTTAEKLIYISRQLDENFKSVKPLLKTLQSKSPAFFRHLNGILTCDGRRSALSGFSGFDGMLTTAEAGSAVKKILAHYIFSPAELERYACCPLRFLFDNLMKLKPDWYTDYHPDDIPRGVLIRQVLAAYCRRKAEKPRLSGTKILQTEVQSAFKDFFQESDDVFSRRLRHSLLAGLNQPVKRPGLFAAFLKFEEMPVDKTILSDGDLEKLVKLQQLTVRLKLDRVERTVSSKQLIAFRFTCAPIPCPVNIKKGLAFDLPLMTLALQALASEKNLAGTAGGAGYFALPGARELKKSGYFAVKELQAARRNNVSDDSPLFSGQRGFGFLPDREFSLELKAVEENLLKIKQLMLGGSYHLPLCEKKDQTCANCPFRRICRKDQTRLDELYRQDLQQHIYKPVRTGDLA